MKTNGSDTLVGRLRKAGMYPACINLFIYFYFYFIYFLLECLWSAKMLRIEGQLAFTKQAYFSPGTCAGSDHD